MPTGSALGVIRALLQEIAKSNPSLNIKAAEGHLMADLLYNNGLVEVAKQQSEDISTEFQTEEENVAQGKFLMDLLFEQYGSARMRKVLQEYSSHSTDQMREESDRFLKALETASRHNRKKSDWLNAILPLLLASLKQFHACGTRCPANSTWPPLKKNEAGNVVVDEDTIERITNSADGTGITSVKDEILAYFHGLTTRSIDRYLDGENQRR